MMRSAPDNWFSWNFRIMDNGDTLAKISLAWVREAGKMHLAGKDYSIYREKAFSGAFVLESGGRQIARAKKSSAFFRHFEVTCSDRNFTLKAQTALTRTFILQDAGGLTIGSIRPEHAFTRKAVIDLPEDIELPVRIFMVWLALILWKREAESATQ